MHEETFPSSLRDHFKKKLENNTKAQLNEHISNLEENIETEKQKNLRLTKELQETKQLLKKLNALTKNPQHNPPAQSSSSSYQKTRSVTPPHNKDPPVITPTIWPSIEKKKSHRHIRENPKKIADFSISLIKREILPKSDIPKRSISPTMETSKRFSSEPPKRPSTEPPMFPTRTSSESSREMGEASKGYGLGYGVGTMRVNSDTATTTVNANYPFSAFSDYKNWNENENQNNNNYYNDNKNSGFGENLGSAYSDIVRNPTMGTNSMEKIDDAFLGEFIPVSMKMQNHDSPEKNPYPPIEKSTPNFSKTPNIANYNRKGKFNSIFRKDLSFYESRLYIVGIPWKATEEELISTFDSFGYKLKSVEIQKNEKGESRGFCFAYCIDEATTEKLLAKKTLNFGGNRYVKIARAFPELRNNKKYKSISRSSTSSSRSSSRSRSLSRSRSRSRSRDRSSSFSSRSRSSRSRSRSSSSSLDTKKRKSSSSSISRKSKKKNKKAKKRPRSSSSSSSPKKPKLLPSQCTHSNLGHCSLTNFSAPELLASKINLCSLCHKSQKSYIWKCKDCFLLLCQLCRDPGITYPIPDPTSKCPHNRGYRTVGSLNRVTKAKNENFNGICGACEYVSEKVVWVCKLCDKVFCKKCQRKYISVKHSEEKEEGEIGGKIPLIWNKNI